MIEIAKNLIHLNIEKSIECHETNLRENNIFISRKQIYNIRNKLKQDKFPSNTNFINNILNINIDLIPDGNKNNKIVNKFCPVKLEIYEHETNKIERLIILTSNFQINLLKEINILFMDGTFNSCPRSFYQIFNILGYIPNKNMSFPIIKSLNLKLNFKKIKIISDFERALRKSIYNNFLDSELMGYYFHYVKSLFSCLKKIGLSKKKIIKQTLKFLFFFKFFLSLNIIIK